MIIGENRILKQANIAKEEQSHATVKEVVGLQYSNYEIDKNVDQTKQILGFLNYLQEKNL